MHVNLSYFTAIQSIYSLEEGGEGLCKREVTRHNP